MHATRLGELLYQEIIQFNELLDTRENIEALPKQLNERGQGIQALLNEMGITKEDQLQLLEELLLVIIAETRKEQFDKP